MAEEQVPSDGDLVRAARAGDGASLGTLFERYRAPLYALALRLLGHGPDAQDAVHDTFLVALRQLNQLREPAAVGGWLAAVLRNVCRMRLRARKGELLLEDPPPFAGGASGWSAEEHLERLVLGEWVWAALTTLPEPQRATIMLRYFGRHASYEEIAAVLGVPLGTVRSRLSQAKSRLAETLLATAGLDHGPARRIRRDRTRQLTAAVNELNEGQGYDLFAATFAADGVIVFSGGQQQRGRRYLIDGLEENVAAGVRLRLTNVLASGDVAIVEGDFENPPGDATHCPPAVTQVHFGRDRVTQRLHLYYAPRPAGGR